MYIRFPFKIGECMYLVSFWGYKKYIPYFIYIYTYIYIHIYIYIYLSIYIYIFLFIGIVYGLGFRVFGFSGFRVSGF